MTRVPDDLKADLKRLLVSRLRLRNVAPESISDDEPLVKGPLGLDSIDLLELALAIEGRYGLKVSDEEVGREAFRSIATLADFVERSRRIAGDQAPADEHDPRRG
jgi:acyl carrier protein